MKFETSTPPAIQPPTEYILTLSEDEASILKGILNNVVGNSTFLVDLNNSLRRVSRYKTKTTVGYNKFGELTITDPPKTVSEKVDNEW